MLRNNRGQIFTIIEILVVVIIIVAAGLLIARTYVGNQKSTVEKVNTPKGRAVGVECMNNLQQIRMAIDVYRQTNEDGRPPTSLKDVESGLSSSMMACPITGVPYSYDPSTGRVWCTTPGHGTASYGGGQSP